MVMNLSQGHRPSYRPSFYQFKDGSMFFFFSPRCKSSSPKHCITDNLAMNIIRRRNSNGECGEQLRSKERERKETRCETTMIANGKYILTSDPLQFARNVIAGDAMHMLRCNEPTNNGNVRKNNNKYKYTTVFFLIIAVLKYTIRYFV